MLEESLYLEPALGIREKHTCIHYRQYEMYNSSHPNPTQWMLTTMPLKMATVLHRPTRLDRSYSSRLLLNRQGQTTLPNRWYGW